MHARPLLGLPEICKEIDDINERLRSAELTALTHLSANVC